MAKTYPSSRDKKYVNALRQKLSIENLIATAQRIAKPGEEPMLRGMAPAKRCVKRCDISFVGLFADNLFDRDGDDTACEAAEKLFNYKTRQQFIDRRIWLRIRFLLIYPYSTHAMSIIKAERNKQRSAIQPPRLHPWAQDNLQVVEDQFYRSSVYASQQNTLETLQEWLDEARFENEPWNSIVVRFTPVSPNLCALFINNTAFFDPYTLAKQHRWSEKLELAPVVQLDQKAEADAAAFDALKDHFRYLWQLNITLDAEDATQYKRVGPGQRSLAMINRPDEIDFRQKAERLVAYFKEARERRASEDRDREAPKARKRKAVEEREERERQDERAWQAAWMTRTRKQFIRYTTTPAPDSPNEHVFVSCCWEYDWNARRRAPNPLASYVEAWLRKDIGSPGTSTFDVQILQAENGENLERRLYSMMNASLLGLVFLTASYVRRPINGGTVFTVDPGADQATNMPPGSERSSTSTAEYHASANVYHEFGYLMSLLDRHNDLKLADASKVFVCRQDNVELPSNVGYRIVTNVPTLEDSDRQALDVIIRHRPKTLEPQERTQSPTTDAGAEGAGESPPEAAGSSDTATPTTPSDGPATGASDGGTGTRGSAYYKLGRELVAWYLYFEVLKWLKGVSTVVKNNPSLLARAVSEHGRRGAAIRALREGTRLKAPDDAVWQALADRMSETLDDWKKEHVDDRSRRANA